MSEFEGFGQEGGEHISLDLSDQTELTDEQFVEAAEEETPPDPGSPFTGTLPADIEEVWGGGKLDGNDQLAETTARVMIGAWGLEAFRESALHKLAIDEQSRDEKLDPIRAAFVKQHQRRHK